MKTKHAITNLSLMLAAVLWGGQAQAQTAGVRTMAAADQRSTVSPTNVDLRVLKTQLEAFQGLLNRSVQQNFSQPFTLLQDAKGSYLPGYGVVFHMEINLYPMRLTMPFGIQPFTVEELRKAKGEKLERIRQLKAQVTKLLFEHGGELSAMAPELNIAIVVHLFNLPSEAQEVPAQLVMSVDRRMLLDYQSRRLSAAEFQQASSILEF